MKRFYRVFFYISGMIIQCFGLTLSTKTDLGASAIISLPFTVGQVTGINFAIFNFMLSLIMVGLQILLNKRVDVKTLLQIPGSFLISSLVGIYDVILPAPVKLWSRWLCMVLAITANGVGGAMMINMKVVPNIADGLANSIGEKLGRNLGFGKNILDFTCVALSCCIGLLFFQRIIGVGVGTVFAMIFVGRVMATFNHFFREPMMAKAGVSA